MKGSWAWLLFAGALVAGAVAATVATADMPGNAYLVPLVMIGAACLIIRKV